MWWFQYVRCSLLWLPRPFLLKGPDHQVQDLLAACQLNLRLHSTWPRRGLLNYTTTLQIVNLITHNWVTVTLPRFSSKESRPKRPRHRWPPCGWHAAVLESHHQRLGTMDEAECHHEGNLRWFDCLYWSCDFWQKSNNKNSLWGQAGTQTPQFGT